MHQVGSLEHQLLGVTLALVEDLSRLTDVVEGRRADLIQYVLPALARLAVAPATEPNTRTICVKVIIRFAFQIGPDHVQKHVNSSE